MRDFVFVWPPKTGGTSIEQTLTAVRKPVVVGLCSVWQFATCRVTSFGHLLEADRPVIAGAKTFVVRRDAADRLRSLYRASHRQHAAQGIDSYAEFAAGVSEGTVYWRVPEYSHNLLCDQKRYVAEPDYVLRFHRIAEDWAAFARDTIKVPEAACLQHQKQTQW